MRDLLIAFVSGASIACLFARLSWSIAVQECERAALLEGYRAGLMLKGRVWGLDRNDDVKARDAARRVSQAMQGRTLT